MSRDVRQTGRGGMRRVEKRNPGRENCYTKPERLECAWFQKTRRNSSWLERRVQEGRWPELGGDMARGQEMQGLPSLG